MMPYLDRVSAVDVVMFRNGRLIAYDQFASSFIIMSKMLGVSHCRKACYPVAAANMHILAQHHTVEVDSHREVTYRCTLIHFQILRIDIGQPDMRLGMNVVVVISIQHPPSHTPRKQQKKSVLYRTPPPQMQ